LQKNKNNPKTKAFAAASKLNMPGPEKQSNGNFKSVKKFAGPIGVALGAFKCRSS
jgi:hypothetical protein